jgi:hypothetical protein
MFNPDGSEFERSGNGLRVLASYLHHVGRVAAEPFEVECGGDRIRMQVHGADANGLYDDEATAMVNTWKRQWFRTPGPRLLYIAPQSWTDRSIPLAVDPKPESTKRVMVIRVEILTPEIEAADVAALRGLASPATAGAARDHFAALGRFAEPRLRRAVALLGHPAYAEPLLADVVETNHTTHKPTAGSAPIAPDGR